MMITTTTATTTTTTTTNNNNNKQDQGTTENSHVGHCAYTVFACVICTPAYFAHPNF